MEKVSQGFQPSGRFYLMVAILIFGAANAVTRRLTDLGAENLVNGRNPISFCNVLFVGNVCALILLAIIYRKQLQVDTFKRINWKQWINLTIVAVLSAAVVPTLVFTALSITAVNNVILVGQVDAPLVLALSVFLLGDRVNLWVILGAIVAFIGISLTVLLQPLAPDMTVTAGFQIGRGELLTLMAAVFKSIAQIISKVSLKEIPLGIFSLFRMVVGTIVFFFATIILYEPSHFMDVTSAFLWQWMLIYSAVIVVGGQLAWFSGLKLSTAGEVSLATAFNPIVGVLAAYLILGEIPTAAQYVGGAVIFVGIILNQIGVKRLNAEASKPRSTPTEMSQSVTFKGV